MRRTHERIRGETETIMNVKLESVWPSNAATCSRARRPWKKWSSYEVKVLKKCAGILTAEEIAQVIGRPVSGVEGKAHGLGISLMMWGEKHQRAKHPDTAREIELKLQFVRMTRQEIETMMNTTDNTTTRLICWEYLQTF